MTSFLISSTENFYHTVSEWYPPYKKRVFLNTKSSHGSICLHDLPLNVLLKIFSYFSENELLGTIMPVCQKWMYTALTPQLWKRLEFNRNLPTNYICHRIKMCPMLQCITLHDVNEPRQVIRQICRCLPNLKCLTVKHCKSVPEKTLRNVLYCCKFLEEMNLSGTPFRGKRFFEDLPLLLNLKRLNLSKNPFMTSKDLLTCVLNSRELEEFRLSKWISLDEDSKFDDQTICPIIINLSRNLKSLTLDCSNLTSLSFNQILTCQYLERLCLYRANNLDGEMFANFYVFFPHLKQLKIKNGNQISDVHIISLFTKGRQVMKKLTLLDLQGCWQISDNGLKAIVDCCHKNLKSLCVQACKSLSDIEPIVENCLALEKLNIAFCTNLRIPDELRRRKLKELTIDETQEKSLSNVFHDRELTVWVSKFEYKKNLEKIEF